MLQPIRQIKQPFLLQASLMIVKSRDCESFQRNEVLSLNRIRHVSARECVKETQLRNKLKTELGEGDSPLPQ